MIHCYVLEKRTVSKYERDCQVLSNPVENLFSDHGSDPQSKKGRLWHVRTERTDCRLFTTTLVCTLKLEFEQFNLRGTF